MKTYLTFLICCLSAMVATAARGERPNIILFLIDDQNPSSIAAFGGDTYTPHLDRMAEEGMKFTRAYVSSSVCTPSRYSFLTGRFAGNSHSTLYVEVVGGKENQRVTDEPDEPKRDDRAKRKAEREARGGQPVHCNRSHGRKHQAADAASVSKVCLHILRWGPFAYWINSAPGKALIHPNQNARWAGRR